MARKQRKSNGTTPNNHLHFPPARIVRFLAGIRSAIGLAESRAVSLEDLEQLSGRPAKTIGSWLDGARMTQLEFLLGLLERIPAGLRHDLIDDACRMQPTLQHPRLAHDPIATSRLETLLKQSTGLTIIQGGPEHAREFLLNALGNSTRTINFGRQSVLGAEIELVSDWAPVPGVSQLSVHGEVRQEFQRAWSKIQQAREGSLILLGHVWQRLAPPYAEIAHLAAGCHVIVADEHPRAEDLVRRVPGPVHLLTVAPAREQPEWIRVTFQER